MKADDVISLTISVAMVILMQVSLWRIFAKAGRAGWTSLIPLYNTYAVIKIANRSGWWFPFVAVPFINVYAIFRVGISLSYSFGKGPFFGFGIILLPFIFLPILAFGDATHRAFNKVGPQLLEPLQPQ